MIGCGCDITPTPAVLAGLGIYRGAVTQVRTGGTSIVAIYGGCVGGQITNPATASDQGIRSLTTETVTQTRMAGPLNTFAFDDQLAFNDDVFAEVDVQIPVYAPPEPLYVSLTGPALLVEGPTTVRLWPGESFTLPPNCASDVWVNSASSGHQFSAIVIQPRTQAPVPYAGTFPPVGPTGLTKTIPSYLYKDFQDDDNLQSLVDAYNLATQTYVDWFNSLYLPVYPRLSGALLDWVGQGLYGIERPTLYSGLISSTGPYNTAAFNSIAFNEFDVVNDVTDVAVTSDDVYKRIITWHFFKGDGKHVTTTWLKRRILRFLYGANGLDYEGSAAQISVLFAGGNLSVTIITGTRKVTAGALNTFAFNESAFNETDTEMLSSTQLPALATIFQEAVLTGALEMPAQYKVTCRLGILGVN